MEHGLSNINTEIHVFITRTSLRIVFDDEILPVYFFFQVCKEYVSFDRLMGMCLCKTDDLEELCNLECRIAQRYRVSFKCSEPPLEPHLILRDGNNTIVVMNWKCLIKFKLFYTYLIMHKGIILVNWV